MPIELIDLGGSRSVAQDDPLCTLAGPGADVTMVIGGDAPGRALALGGVDRTFKRAIVVELGAECLGFHTGERVGAETTVLGFARFRLGTLPASSLVEIVRQPGTTAASLAAAKSVFNAAGCEVAVCSDVPGRIIDSLLRPYLNSALRGVDEGLAAPEDMDRILRLGLGYPKGPLQLLEESGIEAHYALSTELHAALGTPEFVPARRARVQAMRKAAGLSDL